MVNVNFFSEKKLNLTMIADTWKKAFNREFNSAYWKWWFEGNPNNDKIYIGYILENDTLASYYAVSPSMLRNRKREYVKTGLMNMAMTHPDFQGKRLFVKIASELHNKLKQDGFIGVYGFANHNAHHLHRKHLNWMDLSVLNIIRTSQNSFRGRLLKNKNLYNSEYGEINEEIIALAQEMQFSVDKVSFSRNSQNLRWRLLNNPIHMYYFLKIKIGHKNTGIILFKYFGNNIDIMEYFYDPEFEEERYNILGVGVNYLLYQHKRNVNIWSNLHTQEHLILEKLGFVESEFNSYFGIIPFIDDKELLNIKNWHYRFMDSDIF